MQTAKWSRNDAQDRREIENGVPGAGLEPARELAPKGF
jgi:hypothetical protein